MKKCPSYSEPKLPNCYNSPRLESKQMNENSKKITKRLQNRLLNSVYIEDPDTHYSANIYATVFSNILTEEKNLKITSIIMSIKQNSVDPITVYYGFPVTKIKDKYISTYGFLDWNKFRLDCATAMSKKRKKKNE